jgi:hypothetical protein
MLGGFATCPEIGLTDLTIFTVDACFHKSPCFEIIGKSTYDNLMTTGGKLRNPGPEGLPRSETSALRWGLCLNIDYIIDNRVRT